MEERIRLYRRKERAARRASRLWENYCVRENFDGLHLRGTDRKFPQILNKAVR